MSLRRVINVPARGIGKGVMDSLQAIDPDAVRADAPPLLAAGLAGGHLGALALGASWSTPSTRASSATARDGRAPRRSAT